MVTAREREKEREQKGEWAVSNTYRTKRRGAKNHWNKFFLEVNNSFPNLLRLKFTYCLIKIISHKIKSSYRAVWSIFFEFIKFGKFSFFVSYTVA